MAMYRERGLKELSAEVSGEGLGIAGGFVVSGVIGRQVENMLVKQVVGPDSPLTDKLMAWIANNGSKAILYYLARMYDAGSVLTESATKAVAGSIVYDTVIRLSNNGINTADVQLGGYKILSAGASQNAANVQKLVQENSILRTELNKALQKLAGTVTPGIVARPGPMAAAPVGTPTRDIPGFSPDRPSEFKYAASAPRIPDYADRQRRFGAMQGPLAAAPPGFPAGRGIPITPSNATNYPGGVPGTNVALPTGPATAERERAFAFQGNPGTQAMPFNQRDIAREVNFGHMPYGAMPYYIPTRYEARERKYGFSGPMEDGTMASMFGML